MPSAPRLDLVLKACREGVIRWKPSALKRLQYPDLKGFTQAGVDQILKKHATAGTGQWRHRRESDEEWLSQHPEDPWWYAAILPELKFRHGLFVKMKLLWEDGDDEDDCAVEVVSIHE